MEVVQAKRAVKGKDRWESSFHPKTFKNCLHKWTGYDQFEKEVLLFKMKIYNMKTVDIY